MTQRKMLDASYCSYSAASISGVFPKYSPKTCRSTSRPISAAGSVDATRYVPKGVSEPDCSTSRAHCSRNRRSSSISELLRDDLVRTEERAE